MDPSTLPTCFLSHPWAHGYHDFTMRLSDALTSRGIRTWVDEQRILPGQSLQARLQAGVQHESDVFLFILTPETLASALCVRELVHALDAHKPIIVVKRERCEPPPVLAGFFYADFINATFFDAAVDSLVESIHYFARLGVLVALLRSPDPEHRGKAAELLGKLAEPRAVRHIAAQLARERDDDVKYWFAIALGRLSELASPEGSRAKELLDELDRSESPRVRQGVRQARDQQREP